MDTTYIEVNGKEKKMRFRKSLFWDVPVSALDMDKNRRLILERVFTRGNIEEFRLVNQYYTRDEIRDSIKLIGYLDKKTLQFLSKLYQIKPTEFNCYERNL